TGLIVETSDGRQAISQANDSARQIVWRCAESAPGGGEDFANDPAATLTVSGHLRWIRHETATPFKQAVFHLGMISIGRWGRGLVRSVLQRRLIAPRKTCPVRLTRRFEFTEDEADPSKCRVIDQIELLDRRLQIRRLGFTSDLQAAYTAAANVYQQSVLTQWTDFGELVDELNRRRRVTIVRTLGQAVRTDTPFDSNTTSVERCDIEFC
ncbi:MAG TPA: hypothetical protein VF306_21845, partial [Pirellulales bacterium]